MAKKLWKTVEAIQELLQGTSAKVTLEWGDGTKVFISRHVFAVRKPETPKMTPVDSVELYEDEVTGLTPEVWEKLKSGAYMSGRQGGKTALMYSHIESLLKGLPLKEYAKTVLYGERPEEEPANHDKIQGDDNNPWIKDGGQHTP